MGNGNREQEREKGERKIKLYTLVYICVFSYVYESL